MANDTANTTKRASDATKPAPVADDAGGNDPKSQDSRKANAKKGQKAKGGSSKSSSDLADSATGAPTSTVIPPPLIGEKVVIKPVETSETRAPLPFPVHITDLANASSKRDAGPPPLPGLMSDANKPKSPPARLQSVPPELPVSKGNGGLATVTASPAAVPLPASVSSSTGSAAKPADTWGRHALEPKTAASTPPAQTSTNQPSAPVQAAPKSAGAGNPPVTAATANAAAPRQSAPQFPSSGSGAARSALAFAAPAGKAEAVSARDTNVANAGIIVEEEETVTSEDRRVARRRAAGPVRGKVAANDDAPSIGGLIYALEQKPSNRVYRHAAIASGVWAVAGLLFAVISLSSSASMSSWGTVLANPTTFLTATAIIVPIAVIWLLALLSWRAEELRLRSSTMTEVAIRLAEPDRMAEDSIASLGQAVRRQVSFMNEAVGRALGRAGELEALVHNEVAALERSYEENERRIRGLISELANERQALTSTSTSFNETLRTLGREVPTLIEKLSNQQSNLSHIIHGAGENLNLLESSLSKNVASLQNELGGRTNELKGVLENYTGALGEALSSQGQRLQAMLDDRSARLSGTLGGRTEDMQKMLEAYTGALAHALGQRTAQMQSSLADHMKIVDRAIANRTANLQAVFEEYARALDTTLANRAGSFDLKLVERTRALDAAFDERLRLFDNAIQQSTQAIDAAVDSRAKALTAALDKHARTFSEKISRQSLDLDESLNRGINAVRRTSENITRQSLKAIESLAGQSDMLKSVSENLVSQIGSLTNRFEAQGQTILRAANALESVNYKIDSTLQSRHAELSETLNRMVGKADEFTQHVKDYSTTIEGSLSEAETRALAAAERLKIGTLTHREQALSEIERMKSDTDAESERAISALKERLSMVSSEVAAQLGSLTDSFSETSEDVRRRAKRVADELALEQARMREEAERLPHTTRESAEAMRAALQDQLRAIDQLSSLASREAQRRDIGLPVAHGGALTPAGESAGYDRAGGGTARPAGQEQGAGSGRKLSSLSESLAQELGARGGNARGTRGSAKDDDGSHSSWSLGDLLKRASDGDGAQTSQQSANAPTQTSRAAQSLPAPNMPAAGAQDAFTLDIDVLSRALDGATAAVIWQRLKAGQRGIMVRSIYSPEGRRVFDEVARRYPGDPSLQGTINRYITDFERILRDTEARDSSGRLAQSHMTSTMGRVYLLLAHAAGRIS